jgi:prolyl-tRNA editing enzyme YbaK/EbsC (Cys-tRNA(Pro) deacylase)
MTAVPDSHVERIDVERIGVLLTEQYLRDHSIPFRLIAHEQTTSARQEARATGYPPEQHAKSVVLRVLDRYRLAIVPASERLSLRKVRDALELEGRAVRLATEAELSADFPAFDTGALPPLGRLLHADVLIDRRLLDYGRVVSAAGDHRHSMLVDPMSLVRDAGALVLDLIEE